MVVSVQTMCVGVPYYANAKFAGFLRWEYPNSWMVYNGQSPSKMDDLGVCSADSDIDLRRPIFSFSPGDICTTRWAGLNRLDELPADT